MKSSHILEAALRSFNAIHSHYTMHAFAEWLERQKLAGRYWGA